MDKAFQKKLEELAYGRPLYVVAGDSLIEPLKGSALVAPKEAWCTPLYFHCTWQARRLGQYLQKT